LSAGRRGRICHHPLQRRRQKNRGGLARYDAHHRKFTENFSEASKKFRQLYSALNNKKISIRLNPYNLKNEGTYEQPTEEKDFYSVIFKLDPNDDRYGHLRVEVSLQAVMMEWRISVIVYERDRADNERGDIKAD